MRREGRQHGTVRATASGVDGHAKAPTKPTGHSKHTGKCKKARCGQCHTHPVSKSRDKAKGAYKLKCSDVVLNHHLVSWRVAGDRSPAVRWSKYSEASASGVLDALLTDSGWSQGDDEVHNEEEGRYDYGDGFVDESSTSSIHGNEEEEEHDDDDDDEEEEEHDDDDEDDMGFYEVGFVWEYMDEEDWCVVSEM